MSTKIDLDEKKTDPNIQSLRDRGHEILLLIHVMISLFSLNLDDILSGNSDNLFVM